MSDSPAAQLESVFRAIHNERRADVPLLHPNLEVEAVGFRSWQGHWVGILITPWMVGLYLLPGEDGDWPATFSGGNHTWKLPAGDYKFLVDAEDEIGPFHLCTLLSPVKELADQATARAAAEAVLEQVFDETRADEAEEGHADITPQPEDDEPLTSAPGVTRRHFLRKLGG